ncbi:MAG: fructose bisphosphate aldolase [Hyphomicrobiaceae bacterium]|nr:fructose bisphosphate aldolase [Hyphomicrobiaceae bacterium]
MNTEQHRHMCGGNGFIAALDQSGGSTPKALRLYGIEESAYSGDAQMFDMIHQMRSRIMTSPSFTSDRVLAAILFEQTMDRDVAGKPTATYLWGEKGIVPILKIDKGLEAEADGVQLMKPFPDLDKLLARAVAKGIYGTKERSVVKAANPAGIKAIAAQQFDWGRQVLGHGLVPILEPEVDIKAADKAKCEELLNAELLAGLDGIPDGQQVIFKLTIPSVDGFYSNLIAHPKTARVVALSGGYSRDEACQKLAKNPGMIASFSRALTEGLTAQQSDADFNAELKAAVDKIYAASIT